MPAPYSNDLRQRVLLAYKNGEGSQLEIAKRFNLSESSVKRYWQRYQLLGHCEAILSNKGRKSIIKEKDERYLKRLVDRYPTATLNELLAHYNKNRKKKINIMTLHRALKRLHIRRKKLSRYAQEQDRADVQNQRKTFKKKSLTV